MAGAEFVRVNLRHRRDQPLQQRFLGHLQAEHRDRLAAANGDVFHQVQRQRGFSLRRPRRENEQLRMLEAGGELVQFRIAGGNPGDALALFEYFFQALKVVANDVLDRDQAGTHAVFGERKDRGLGAIKNGVGAFFSFKRALLNIVCGVNQVAQDGFLFDNARIVLDVGYARHAVGQRSEVRRAARSFEFAFAVQFFGQGHQVDGLLAFAERNHVGKDTTVLIEEKNLRVAAFRWPRSARGCPAEWRRGRSVPLPDYSAKAFR